MTASPRDLSAPEHWHRSLERSRRRRTLAAAGRKTRSRRKRASWFLSAAVAVAPSLPTLAMAQGSGGDGAGSPQDHDLVRGSQNEILLERGTSGPAVTVVQRALKERDLLVLVDGYYGPETERAVSAFQRAKGLPNTGKVDLRTFLALIPPQTSSEAGYDGPSRLVLLSSVEGASGRPSNGSEAASTEGSFVGTGPARAAGARAGGRDVAFAGFATATGDAALGPPSGQASGANRPFSASEGDKGSANARGSRELPGNGASITPESTKVPTRGEQPRLPAQTTPSEGRWSRSLASWYGPGLYGNRTACGLILRSSTQGVAHKSLACGTLITFSYRGRTITVPVIDRGPFTGSRVWDLTEASARALGLTSAGVDYVEWRPARSERSTASTVSAPSQTAATSSAVQAASAPEKGPEATTAASASSSSVETGTEASEPHVPRATVSSTATEGGPTGALDRPAVPQSDAQTGGGGADQGPEEQGPPSTGEGSASAGTDHASTGATPSSPKVDQSISAESDGDGADQPEQASPAGGDSSEQRQTDGTDSDGGEEKSTPGESGSGP